MKKRTKKMKKMKAGPVKRFQRLHIIGIIAAIIVLAVGAAAAVSVRTIKLKSQDEKRSAPVINENNGKHITANAMSQAAKIDNQTGQIRPLTPEEAQALADGIKPLLNQSDEGLKQVRHPDGSVSVDLEGRFQEVAVAQKNTDGSVSQSCVNNTDAAADFFGIDRRHFENQSKNGTSKNSKAAAFKQPVSRATAKGEIK